MTVVSYIQYMISQMSVTTHAVHAVGVVRRCRHVCGTIGVHNNWGV